MKKAVAFSLRVLLLAALIPLLFYVGGGILMTFLPPWEMSFDVIGVLVGLLVGVFAAVYAPPGPFVAAAPIAATLLALPDPHLPAVALLTAAFLTGFFPAKLFRDSSLLKR